jgi:uncharacterized phiE125 gp8 family phage protein
VALILVTPPATEPVSLAEARLHLRIADDVIEDDDLITDLITAARQQVENVTGLALIEQTWRLDLSGWREEPWHCWLPSGSEAVQLPRPPLIEVTELAYDDVDGDEQELTEDTDFVVVLGGETAGLVLPAYSESWPTVRPMPNAVRIEYSAGYGGDAGDVPQALRQAMLLLIGHWYENREAAQAGALSEAPLAVESLLAPYRSTFCV